MTRKMVKTSVEWDIDNTKIGDAIEYLYKFPSDAEIQNFCGDISINYERLETDQEYETRLAYEKQKAEAQKIQDERFAKQLEKEQYATYLMLKERFEK